MEFIQPISYLYQLQLPKKYEYYITVKTFSAFLGYST